MRHEGVPGHLFQRHVAAQSARNHARRLFISAPGYVEGWAEYTSDLGLEVGLPMDHYARLERLGGRVFMAARIVVDIGVNWHGWTADQGNRVYGKVALWAAPELLEAVVRTAFESPANQAIWTLSVPGSSRSSEATQPKSWGRSSTSAASTMSSFQHGVLPLGALEEHIHERVAKRTERNQVSSQNQPNETSNEH